MKALLLKDLCVLYKQLRHLLLPLVIFCLMPGDFASVFSVIYAIMLPVTAMGFDQSSKWDQLARMMPYTLAQLVFSKYVLGYMGTGAAFVLSVAARAVVALVTGSSLSGDSLLPLFLFPCAGLLLLAVNLPLLFRFGPEKGRLIYLFACGAAGALAAMLPQDLALPFAPLTAALAVFLLTPVIQYFSYRLSLKFYSIKNA